MTKICPKCGVEKSFSEFHKNKSKKDGLAYACKGCKSLRSRQYYENNKEKLAERKRQYRENNKEKLAERDRQYYENNKEKIAERKRQWLENNKEKVLEQKRQYIKNLPAGIYKITNKQAGVVYIGCSTQLKARFARHKNYLKKNKHDNRLLQEAYNQCGLKGLKFEVIKEYPADTPFEVLEKEETRLILENHTKGIPMYNLSIKINSIDENLLTK